MVPIGTHNDFEVFFDCLNQVYKVYKSGKLISGDKCKFSEIASYLGLHGKPF